MGSGVRAIAVTAFVVAAGLIGAAALDIGRDTSETIHALASLGSGQSQDPALSLRRCLDSARCRTVLLQRPSEILRAHEAGLRAAVALLGCWIVCALLLRWRVPSSRSPAGAARYARGRELRRLRADSAGAWLPLGYLSPPASMRRLVKFPGIRGICRAITGPQVRLPAEDLARHMLVVGLTGSHKTTALTFPVLLEAARQEVSVVALDLKYGEADSLARTATEWKRCMRDVLTFAPLDPGSLRWNPLDRCRTMGDFYQFAAELCDEVDPSDSDLAYWLGAERHVCAVLCYALATDGGHATLGRLRSLCESGPDAVEAYVRRHNGSPDLASRLGAYAAMLRKDQAGILQGVAARLEAWADESVCAATGPSAPWERIDIGRVRREPLLLVVGVPQHALARLRWLCRLFLRRLASTLLRPRSADERTRVLLVLEELPAWGALPGLADHLATLRSRAVSVVATLQSEAQGEYVYGRSGWAAVAANLVTKVYLPPLADFDAERLSRWLGTSVGEDVAWSRGWGSAGIRTSEHRRAVSVPLARPEALRDGGGPDEILVRFANLPAAWLWCPAYYLRPEYHGRIPESRITTADLALYHHLWAIRGRASVPMSREREAAVAGRSPGAAPPGADGEERPTPEPAPECATPSAHTPVEAAPPATAPGAGDDVRHLNQVMETLVLRVRRDAGSAVWVVQHRGRLVEVRVRPDIMVEICRGADAMHALARRWSAFRWVRRVRPTFVVSRRALENLDPGLRATLSEMRGRDSSAAPSPAGRDES